MSEEFLKAMKRYEDTFDDMFPTMSLFGSEKELIEIIDKCIEAKKDVYDLGYLSLEYDY